MAVAGRRRKERVCIRRPSMAALRVITDAGIPEVTMSGDRESISGGVEASAMHEVVRKRIPRADQRGWRVEMEQDSVVAAVVPRGRGDRP